MKRELLRIDHVTITENEEILLNNINFNMYSFEIMGFIAKEEKGVSKFIELICRNIAINTGSVWFAGNIVNRYSYSDNQLNKVYLLEEKSHLVESLSIADNIFVLRQGFKKLIISERVLEKQVMQYIKEHRLTIDIYSNISDLSSIDRCIVELIKADIMGYKLIIVDNPASYLTKNELEELYKVLLMLKKKGISVLYIGNHHEEVFNIADRTSLYSDGYIKKVFDYEEMTDGNIKPYISEWFFESSKLQEVSFAGQEERYVLFFDKVCHNITKGLSFALSKGECLTLIDMDNGLAQEISDILTGNIHIKSGKVIMSGRNCTDSLYGSNNIIDENILILSGDTTEKNLFKDMSYLDNLMFMLDRRLKKSIIKNSIRRSIYREYKDVAGDSINEKNLKNLKFTELIKLVYLKVLIYRPKFVYCIQPLARGDMLARVKILGLIKELMSEGISVLIVSTNCSDLLEVADRVSFIEQGRIKASYDKEEFDSISK